MSGYVYFITCEPDQYVKIGWSLRNPTGRLNTLQTGCPEALRLMAFFPGSQEDERRLHQTFDELRYRGEWFFNQYKLLDLIRYLSDGYPRETNTGATREVFEAATWDVIITGYEHPDMDDRYLAEYRRSGAGHLWTHLHPEMAE
jgi:hypothetical protein